MIVINSIDEFNSIKGKVGLSIGTFDGCHIAHTRLIKKLIDECEKHNYKSVVYTYSNHPREFTLNKKVSRVISIDEKIKCFESMGVDILILLQFDEFQRDMSPDFFMQQLLFKYLDIKYIAVGFDFRFGKNAIGNPEFIRDYIKDKDVKLYVLDSVSIDGKKVSSTIIRKMLSEGNIQGVNKFLGRKYSFCGEVVHGKHVGSKLGFPTANLKIYDSMSLLKSGVYITNVLVRGKCYTGVTNIGFNPTFKQSNLNVETHIMDFDLDIYGEQIKVEFIKRIRDEMVFSSKDELVKRIEKDVEYALNYK